MLLAQNSKIYMTAEDETEETLLLVSVLEGIPVAKLYESIDLHRSAGCGFARAAKIFATQYLHGYLESQAEAQSDVYANAITMQRAMTAVANDRPTKRTDED